MSHGNSRTHKDSQNQSSLLLVSFKEHMQRQERENVTGEWVEAEGVALKQGDTLEYRVELYAYNCLRTPRIEKIVIDFD